MANNKEEKTSSSGSTKPSALSHLSTGLLNLWVSRDHADITILVEDQEIPCHKVVLVAASPYFEAMFKSGMKEAVSSKVKLREMTATTFECVLEFVYTGNDIVTRENVSALLEASSLLQIQALFERCEEFLLNNISVSDCIEIWRLSYVFNSEKLMKNAFQFVLANFTALTEQESFNSLSLDELMKIISDDRLNTPSEESVVQAVLAWGQFDKEREPAVGNLFSKLRLCQLSSEFLYAMKRYFTTTIDSEIARQSIDEAIELKLVQNKMQTSSSCFVRYRQCNAFEEVFILLGSCHLYAYSFCQNEWFSLCDIDDFESPISGAMCSHDGSLFITGGWLYSAYRVYEYKFASDKWFQLQPLQVGRNSHSMFAASNSLFVLGGERDTAPHTTETLSSIERYSFIDKKWKMCGNLIEAATRSSAAIVDNKIILLGGIGIDYQPLNVVQYFDVLTYSSACVTVPTFSDAPNERLYKLVQCDDKIYCFGVGGILKKFNLESETFETLKSTSFEVEEDSFMFQKNGKLYLINEEHFIELDPEAGREFKQINTLDMEGMATVGTAKFVIEKKFLKKPAT